MAKPRQNEPGSDSRKGKPEIGTVKIGLQIPEQLRAEYAADVEHRGPQAVRFMGTAAMAVMMGMPKAMRDKLFRHVQRARWEEMREVGSEEIWALFETLYAQHSRERKGNKHG